MKENKKKGFLMRIPEQTYNQLRELSLYTALPMAELVCQSLSDWNLNLKIKAARKMWAEPKNELQEKKHGQKNDDV